MAEIGLAKILDPELHERFRHRPILMDQPFDNAVLVPLREYLEAGIRQLADARHLANLHCRRRPAEKHQIAEKRILQRRPGCMLRGMAKRFVDKI
ncbi:MAG: hypothetical protein EOR85_13100 [Mesorhizobium sp.]|uniref:hypothetical protein n=1 Tax=Mesorhizobium sp. TaxID=1871066 RepID=UPI000FE46B79|nr:hypothetical protein [Mesorhizobium sp.]RWK61777.1 MAG: hypothetical protein EOR49_15935 [Mesorhizobium sp.]RWM47704.1 MAG: hypothetical protein EOR76_14425 [Mesorhizobium sp.]RWN02436.1 MAG: hypothetical protein EOR85_13100 [Mesorhizobium sp.]